jgi:hypothetical protein
MKYTVVINPVPITPYEYNMIGIQVEADSDEEAQNKAWEEIRWAHSGFKPRFVQTKSGEEAKELWDELGKDKEKYGQPTRR